MVSWRCQRPLEKTEQCKQSYNRWNRAAGLLHSTLQWSSHVLIITSYTGGGVGVGDGVDGVDGVGDGVDGVGDGAEGIQYPPLGLEKSLALSSPGQATGELLV